jgi:hypothetical protein
MELFYEEIEEHTKQFSTKKAKEVRRLPSSLFREAYSFLFVFRNHQSLLHHLPSPNFLLGFFLKTPPTFLSSIYSSSFKSTRRPPSPARKRRRG